MQRPPTTSAVGGFDIPIMGYVIMNRFDMNKRGEGKEKTEEKFLGKFYHMALTSETFCDMIVFHIVIVCPTLPCNLVTTYYHRIWQMSSVDINKLTTVPSVLKCKKHIIQAKAERKA